MTISATAYIYITNFKHDPTSSNQDQAFFLGEIWSSGVQTVPGSLSLQLGSYNSLNDFLSVVIQSFVSAWNSANPSLPQIMPSDPVLLMNYPAIDYWNSIYRKNGEN